MATNDETLAGIVQDVLSKATVDIVGRAAVAGLSVRHMKAEARVFLVDYKESHLGERFAVEYTDERR